MKGNVVDLSIVVPVYNALPYCEALAQSIVSQDFGDYNVEAIIVDDGSTDGSGEYFDRVAEEYPMIRVFHQANSGGPASPRNFGIEHSNSNYLFFADSDGTGFCPTKKATAPNKLKIKLTK